MKRTALPVTATQANPTCATAVAHLRLQCREDPLPPGRGGSLPPWALRLLRRLGQAIPGAARSPSDLVVSIQALDGRVLLRHSAPAQMLDVGLPPGTYHVSVQRGEASRRYTVTLLPDADIRLQLVPPPAPP